MAQKKSSSKSKFSDKGRKAKHPGKRTSASGKTYYESRPNRSDKNRTTRLAKGGQLQKKVSLKQLVKGK